MSESNRNIRPFRFSLWKLLSWTAVFAAYLGILRLVGHWLSLVYVLATWLPLLVFARIRFGYKRGALVAILITIWIALACATPPLFVFVMEGVSTSALLLISVSLPLACLLAMLCGYCTFLVIHLLVNIVDRNDLNHVEDSHDDGQDQ